MVKKIYKNKELLITSGIIILCLVLFSIFPTENEFQKIVSSLVFLLVIPILYVKIILKKKLGDFGVQTGIAKRGIIWAGISLGAALLVFYIVYNYTGFPREYNLPQIIVKDFKFFVLFEILLVGFFNVLYEFFFRGFVMFQFSERLGYWSIAVQALLFAAFFLMAGDFGWAAVPSMIAAPFAGLAAYKSRSLIYSFSMSLFFIIIVDALVIKFSV